MFLRASRPKTFVSWERLAYWLDNSFRIPGLGWRFGFDAGMRGARRPHKVVVSRQLALFIDRRYV